MTDTNNPTTSQGGGATAEPNLWKKYQHLFADEQPNTELDDDGMLHSHDKTFGKLPAILIHDTGVTDGAARLYAHMHWRYGRNRKNFEGRAKMAKHLGVTETTITKRIQELEAAHWIVVIERGRSNKGGAYQTPFYHVFESQDDAEYFRFYYKPKDGETIRPRSYVEPRKSRKGKGGNPKLKAASTQVHGVNSSSHGAVNSSSHYPEAVYPDSISVSTEVDSVIINDDVTDTSTVQSKRPRKPDVIFDTLAELHWNIHDTSQVDKTTAIRINKIKSWLKENSPGATAETLRSFATWFADETNGLSLPRDKAKFAERFVEFREYCEKRKGSNGHAPDKPMVKHSDLFAELDGVS